MDNKRVFAWVCGVFLVVALLLRVLFVSSEALWGDEVFTIRFVTPALADVVERTVHDVHPPLYFLLMHFWVKIAGVSEAALRAPSIFFSVLSLVLFYFLCRRFKLDALLGTTIFGLSLSGLVYAHEARSYSLILFLVVGAWLCLTRMVQEKKGYVGYVLFFTLLLYTHVLGLVVFALTSVFVVFSFSREQILEKKFFASCVMPLVLFLPWLPAFLLQIRDFLPLLLERLALNTAGIVTSLVFWVLFGIGCVGGVVLVVWKVAYCDRFSLLLLLSPVLRFLSSIPFFVAVCWILFFSVAYPFFAATHPFVRYVIYVLPVVYLLLTIVLEKKKSAALLVMAFSLVLLVVNVSAVDRFGWRGAADYAAQYSDGAVFGLDRAGTSPYLFAYYARGAIADVDDRMIKLRVASTTGNDTFYPFEKLDSRQKYVLVLSKLRGEKSVYETYLETTHILAAARDFKDVRVVVFESVSVP